MIWPDRLDLDLTGIAQGGAAVGRYEGRVVFAYGGLPGERVSVRLKQRQKAFASGDVVAVHDASAQRIAPRDSTASHADWQWIAYPEQLRLKAQVVAEQLAHLGALGQVPVAPTLAAPQPWNYRNSATFHGDAAGLLGYYAPGSRRVLDRTSDPLLLPQLNLLLQALHSARVAGSGLRKVTLRVSASRGELLGVLEGDGDLDGLARRWQQEAPGLAGVVEQRRGQVETLLGADALYEDLGGLALRISATSFFQVNSAQAAMLLDLVLRKIAPAPGKRVLDAYCGVGTFALPLATAGAEVLGIEEHPAAVADARFNAERHGLALELRCGRVEALLPELESSFDAVVLDPPRRGVEPAALQALAQLAPPLIVYVSCHPGTLARDLQLLAGAGYRIVHAQPVDMFPQTHHIETVAYLER